MATPVSQLFELCQQLRIPPPKFHFEMEATVVGQNVKCIVIATGIGNGTGTGLDNRAAKHSAAQNLLDSSQGKACITQAKVRYSWTGVEGKVTKDLAQELIRRTQATLELLNISTKPGFPPTKRAEVRARIEKHTKQLGVLLADFQC